MSISATPPIPPHLAPDFRLRLWEGEALATRDRYRHMVAWDAVASGGDDAGAHRDTRRHRNGEDRGAERLTELLELPPFRVESRFVVADGEILVLVLGVCLVVLVLGGGGPSAVDGWEAESEGGPSPPEPSGTC